MNWLDLCLLIVVAGAIASGVGKGFARTAAGFVTSVLALLCAFWLYRPMGFAIRPYVDSRPLANVIGFLIVLAVISIAGAFAGKALAKAFAVAQLTWLDRLLGGAFGIVRGVFSAMIMVVIAMALVPPVLPHALHDSVFVPYLSSGARLLVAAAPDELRDGFRRARRDLEAAPVPDALKKGVARLDPDM